MELRHLRYFVAVADHGSFVEASRRLYVSQSAISEQIADLESELGGTLFLRKSRRLYLTPQGTIFLAEARKILTASSHAISLVRRSLAGEVGTLSLGFFSWGIGPYFTDSIREFKRTHPGVNIELHEMLSREQMDSLTNGKIDVGFGRPLPSPYDRLFASEPLYKERMMVVLPAGHPLAGPSVDISDLANEKIVLRDRNGLDTRYDEILQLFGAAGFEPDVVSTAKSWNGVLSLVEAGIGIALAPSGIERIATDAVLIQPLTPEANDVGIAMTWNSQKENMLLEEFLAVVRKNSKVG